MSLLLERQRRRREGKKERVELTLDRLLPSVFDDVESLSKQKRSQLQSGRALEEGWTYESKFDPVPNSERDLRRSHRGGREVVAVGSEEGHLFDELLLLPVAKVDRYSSFPSEKQI